MMTAEALRADVEYHWPTYKFGDGLVESLCETFARTSPEAMANAIRKQRAEDFDAARPNWKRIGTIVVEAGARGAMADAADRWWWGLRVRAERAAGTWHRGMSDVEMMVQVVRWIAGDLGDSQGRAEIRTLMPGLLAAGHDVPDYFRELRGGAKP